MREIKLTKGYYAKVDDDVYDYLMQWSWHVQQSKKGIYYASRTGSLAEGDLYKAQILMHRVIMKCPEGLVIDHINRDRLNNCTVNLRICTQSQNQMNRGIQSNNKSGYRGVSWNKGAWRARIKVGGKEKGLGRFKTKEAAYEAYCRANIELHGEYGCFE